MSAPYVWLITDDDLAAPGDRADRSTAGPARVSEGLEKAIRSDDLPIGFTRAVFRMYDDDGTLYYRGRMFYAEELDGTEEQVFAPLAEFGLPNAGCTRIAWNDDDHYETY